MDRETLDSLIKDIHVQNIDNEDVQVENNTTLKMMGKGRQGAVFQLSEEECMKVFGNEEDCQREYFALSLGQHTDLFPKVYEKGPNYISMEIIKGVDVREFLQSQPLTPELSNKLIDMLIVFKEIGFERIDHHKRQIFLQPDGSLKVIDVARTVWRDRVYPYPRKLLTSLGKENKEIFLAHVQASAPALYEEWKYFIDMEQQSREILQELMQSPTNTVKTKKKTKILLKTQKNYSPELENIVHKVFKEEWVKAMLVLGYNPDEVMELMDNYWANKEQSFQGNAEKLIEKLLNAPKKMKKHIDDKYQKNIAGILKDLQQIYHSRTSKD
ncbi:hypothetical protein [Niallia sp. NCCP-28]|uniref:hypothetical protein n=1 Tax=Niallia sp. NCCP-28 TaxID=2934712 RepID=UPI00208CF0C8|nr:hypothetical protein [Niallia sp. NCCP-28]GKU82894.1 hypothetical protein NCCP28_22900 [Niallia sp. NCCP-28]